MADDYYTLMTWLKDYMVVLQTLFEKLCPLLQTHQRLRVTIINMKRINTNYFTKNDISNIIWRLFIDSRTFFSTMSNEHDLRKRIHQYQISMLPLQCYLPSNQYEGTICLWNYGRIQPKG